MKPSTLPRGRDTGLIRLYAWVMIVITALAVVAALHATRTEPRYASSAEILVGPTITPSGNYIEPSMPTEQRLATSADVISMASAALGVTTQRPLQELSVSVPVDTQVLVMTYTADTPEAALAGAKAFTETYLRVRNPKGAEAAVATLVGPPVLPSGAVSTNYPVILGAAVVGGLLIGFVVARAWDRVRGRIRTIDDAEQSTGLDALALTPRLLNAPTRKGHYLAGRSQLNFLAARVLEQVEGGPPSSVLVTGAAAGCGSSAVAVQTAVVLAQMGRPVVLVSPDGAVAAGVSHPWAPSRWVNGSSGEPWLDARTTDTDGLCVVPVVEWDDAGVAAARMTSLLPELHERFPGALIVIDGPPAWCSAGIALRTDRILLVVALGRSTRSAAALAVHALDHCADKIMGLVVTPRRALVRDALQQVRCRAALRVARFMVWIGPPWHTPVPTTGPQSPPVAGPSPHEWRDSAAREDSGPRAPSGSERMGEILRLPARPSTARPSTSEPTTPVLSP